MAISQAQVEKIVRFGKSYGVTRLILFGSSAAPLVDGRDIDLACDGIKGWKLYEFAAKLEEELRRPLDVIPLSPPSRFTRRIENKGMVLL